METGQSSQLGQFVIYKKEKEDMTFFLGTRYMNWHCIVSREQKKYGERNCKKGIPIHSLIDSAIRHLSCYLRGMDDEPHLRAAMWNIAFAIWIEKKKPEMQLELQGELKSLMNQLKELGVNNLEEAEEMIHQMEKDLEKMRESIEEQIEQIEELMEGGEEDD